MELLIVIAADNGADLSCSNFVTFSQYLELVVARYGFDTYDGLNGGWGSPRVQVSEIEKPGIDAIVEEAIWLTNV